MLTKDLAKGANPSSAGASGKGKALAKGAIDG